MRRWTISDIAESAGVSKTTVSRVLNEKPDVDAETSARVLKVVEEVGYVRSAKAMQLAKGRANVVGLLAPFDTTPWMIEVLRGAMEEVQAARFSLTLHAFPNSDEDVEHLATQLRGGFMDALFVVSLQRPLGALVDATAGLPVIALDNYGFNGGLPGVIPDEASGIAEAVAHLVAIGRRHFAFVAGPADNPVSQPRLDAYHAALRMHGLELDEKLVATAAFTEPSAREATLTLLDGGATFDALFASSDAMAVGAMRALKQLGRQVPRDVSVVGFDDFSAAEFTEPRLTTVHNPLFEMSRRAVARLLKSVTDSAPLTAGDEVVRTYLIIRDSSDPSRGG